MSAYDWIEITEPQDYGRLTDILDPEFGPESVSAKLQGAITNQVRAVLVEHGYVDKDYRSTFYNFYAKMGRVYRNDCVRLHFFDENVSFDEKRTDLVCPDNRPEDHYFGYVVLRPTISGTFGRSILSPNIRVGAHGRVIQSRHHVHLLGHKLSVWGFPSMAQHADIVVCAHVACWAILRHYSERFPSHRELLVHDITRLASPFDPGGLVPSLGLDISQAERIFQAAGCFPLIVDKRATNSEVEFYSQLLAYLESGFPLYVAMTCRQHAVVIAGYAWDTHPSRSIPSNPHVWSQISTLLVIDDNLLPYENVAVQQLSPVGPSYTIQDFDAFIVPLPEKIFYPADAVEKFSKDLPSSLWGVLEVPDGDKLLKRYFVTTISALRYYARERESELGEILVDLLMQLDTAQFIWIVEYSSKEQWGQEHITVRAIVDASASPPNPVPIWLVHNGKRALVFDHMSADIVELKRSESAPLGRMEKNLRPIL